MTSPAQDAELLEESWRREGGETGAQIAEGVLEGRLGSARRWPAELVALVSFALSAHEPIAIWWGADRVALFNDAWTRLGGGGWIARLGAVGETALPRDWSGLMEHVEEVFSGAPGLWLEDQRIGYSPAEPADEDYFTVSFNPARDRVGVIGGVVAICTETTTAVRCQRRLSILRRLSGSIAQTEDNTELCRAAANALSHHRKDLPRLAFHLFDDAARQAALAAGDEGMALSDPAQAYADLQTEEMTGERRRLMLRHGDRCLGAFSAVVPGCFADDEAHDEFLEGIRDTVSAALALRHQMRDREAALASFRHRIQNNLQAVSALVSASSNDGPLDTGILHDRISQMGAGQIALSNLEPGRIAADKFVPLLVREIGATFPNVTVRMAAPAEPMIFDDAGASALAFIIGENARAVQNGNPGGAITISLTSAGDGQARLDVEHDRMVPPRDHLPLADMVALFARQLGGEMTVEGGDGAPVFSVIFPRDRQGS